MILKINKYQIKLTTNNHYRIQFINNKLTILSTFDPEKIYKLLDQNYITYKTL
jgi:hypothetical protein